VQPFPHGYTNDTRGDREVVVKRYQGPDARGRRDRERLALSRLAGRLPVPPLRECGDDNLAMGFLPGRHGQDLIDAGHAPGVLRSCGEALRRIHAVDVASVFPDPPAGSTLVHGDFGPNNLLFDPETLAVTAILDWEWAHPGVPVEDLAWCEWIVRTHHPAEAGAIEELFRGYGETPGWPDRQRVMVDRCTWLVEFCEQWQPGGPGAEQWRLRRKTVAGWVG
jgi:tRNA A-37 threonylcarbamoyl transferase component Bud32